MLPRILAMNIFINGSSRATNSDNIDLLVDNLELPRAGVLIEHNGVALLRSEWPQARLAEGDRIEILKVAAGG
jgi:sulfur carrier protein